VVRICGSKGREGGEGKMKDRFITSLSGNRYVRFSKITEFKISETYSFPHSHQLAGRVGSCGCDWMVVFKGTLEECETYLEGTLKEEV
jgi:hypothetical protein